MAFTLRNVTGERSTVELRVVGGRGIRAHSSHKSSRRYPAPDTARRTILYIGADPDCRVVLSRIVRRLDRVHLVATQTGREGRLLAVSCTPNLIVLDAQLPACGAHNLLSYLARSAFTAAIPLVIVSGNEDERTEFIRAGAAAWMTKPLRISEVERTTTALLELVSLR